MLVSGVPGSFRGTLPHGFLKRKAGVLQVHRPLPPSAASGRTALVVLENFGSVATIVDSVVAGWLPKLGAVVARPACPCYFLLHSSFRFVWLPCHGCHTHL
ncbi:propionyl-CoA synthetase [Sesbania bispinosa]|nr:propionyl-CoA synthetase [Sesbania bispinosa]